MTIIGALPVTLQNGTTADATDVMADLNKIRNDTNANAAANGANSDITSLTGMTTPLSVAQGGTGTALGPGAILLTSGTVSAAATLDIVLTSYTSYRAIKFLLTALIPATNDVALWMRFSTNGGSSYNAGASDYSYATFVSYTADDYSSADSKIILVPISIFGISNAATGGVSLEVTLYDQTSTTRYSAVRSSALPVYTGIASPIVEANGYRNTAQDTDAVRFLFSSGNIASGKYAVYGLR